MRTHSPLVLDVRELLDHPGSRKSVDIDAVVGDLGTALSRVDGEVHLSLTLEAIDGGILVRGTITGTYEGQCRRCLKPVSHAFELEGSELYRPSGDVWEEGYAVEDATIDLDLMARDTIGLSLPPNPLCRPDCAGLCSRCGADLNEGPCGCGEQTDPRWSALRELMPPSG